MRNRILYITRNTIPYVKELMPLAKSVTGCILMQQLDFWFERFPEGFYKFQDSTAHPMYKPGHSWCEELAISVDEFRTAFDKVGIRYKSKSEYEKAEDKFQGKFYCSYVDRRAQLTYYFRNHDQLDRALDELIIHKSSDNTPTPQDAQKEPPTRVTKRVGSRDQLDRTEHFPVNRESPSPANGESPFTGNQKSPLLVNRENTFTVNQESSLIGSRESSLPQIEHSHLQEVEKVQLLITETTNINKTQLLNNRFDSNHNNLASETSSGSNPSNLEEQHFDELVFPTKTHSSERKHLFTLLRQCPPERRQEVLDEIEGAACKNKLRSGIVPFARYLIAAIQNDQFLPNLGIEVLAKREEAAIAQKTIAAMHHRTESQVNAQIVEELSEKARALIPPGIMEKFESYRRKEKNSQGKIKDSLRE